jgi:ABC-2 type transport system ATP-binding protein
MDEVENTYLELMVVPANAAAARQFVPLHERELFGRHIFLYRGVKRELLEDLGELRTPSVADLFVATMSGEPS